MSLFSRAAAGQPGAQYQPEHAALGGGDGTIDLDWLADQSRMMLRDDPKAMLEALIRVGGSPQGARPKALIG